jgi:hypothetical protein
MIFSALAGLYKYTACDSLNLRIRHEEQHSADDGSHENVVQGLLVSSKFEDVHSRFLSQQRGAPSMLKTYRMSEGFLSQNAAICASSIFC